VVPEPYLNGRNGYAVVLMSQPVNVGDRHALHQTLDVVGLAGRDLPLLWLMHDPIRDLFIKSRLDRGLSARSITVVAMQPYSVYLDILRGATCVITDSWNVQEEAAALGIPCVVAGMRGLRPSAVGQRFGHLVGLNKAAITRAVWDCIFTGGRRPVVPPQWDGQTAARLVDHLYARVAAAPMRATA
jgi:UDP-N-acetylglucosamine 2-epimerase (non-hydrolysing)